MLSSGLSALAEFLVCIFFLRFLLHWGYWRQLLMRGLATLPQGNKESVVVRDKVVIPQMSLGVSMSLEYDIPLSALTLLIR